MKIIAGSLRGTVIPTAKNADYRPTTSKLKEALFSMLTSGRFCESLEGKVVLDLFAGTGSLGLEAISRGASHTTFVDIDNLYVQSIQAFALKYKILDKTSFLRGDATRVLVLPQKYDIIFLDPPYEKKIVEKALEALHNSNAINNDALFVIEIGRKEDIALPKWCTQLDERRYGGSKMIIARFL